MMKRSAIGLALAAAVVGVGQLGYRLTVRYGRLLLELEQLQRQLDDLRRQVDEPRIAEPPQVEDVSDLRTLPLGVITHDFDLPLLSVILPTRDRPDLLAVALECYRRQTYPHRELIVVDDGEAAPADRSAVRAAGGRLVQVRPGTPLGTKLNLGLDATDGTLCQILDDATWYAPTFLDTMVRALLGHWTTAYQPAIATIAPHLVFLLPDWLVGRTAEVVPAAGSLLFQREDWDERPFRPSDAEVGAAYLRDQYELGIDGLAVHAVESCLAVHLGGEDDPATALPALEMYGFGMPESILPDWALRTYRHLDARSRAGVEVGCPG